MYVHTKNTDYCRLSVLWMCVIILIRVLLAVPTADSNKSSGEMVSKIVAIGIAVVVVVLIIIAILLVLIACKLRNNRRNNAGIECIIMYVAIVIFAFVLYRFWTEIF